jgi:tetratricopeptide (TPR) repeat protein
MYRAVVAQQEPFFSVQLIAAAGAAARIGTRTVALVPFEDQLAVGELFCLAPPVIASEPVDKSISQAFEAHIRATFRFTSQVPSDPQELDERIALLSALLQARGAMGLEYYLARCLVTRNRPGDAGRALVPHARRSTGPQSPAEAWALRIKLEDEIEGADSALKVAREGIDLVPPSQSLFTLYHTAAEIIARDGKPDDAIKLLNQGIAEITASQNAFVLYHTASSILLRYGRVDEALAWLIDGSSKVTAAYNGHRLVEGAISVAYAEDCFGKLAALTFDAQRQRLLDVTTALANAL